MHALELLSRDLMSALGFGTPFRCITAVAVTAGNAHLEGIVIAYDILTMPDRAIA